MRIACWHPRDPSFKGIKGNKPSSTRQGFSIVAERIALS